MSSSDDKIDTNEMNNFTSTIQFHESEENEPPPKWFKHSNLVWNLLEQENSTSPVAPLSDGDKEIEKYLDSMHSAEEMTLDPLDYSIQKKDLYLAQQAKLQGEREIAYLMTT